jgi:hypothetical protein
MSEDIVDWLISYALATAADGSLDDADKLYEAAEHIVKLRAECKKIDDHRIHSEELFIKEMGRLGAEMRGHWESAVFWQTQASKNDK